MRIEQSRFKDTVRQITCAAGARTYLPHPVLLPSSSSSYEQIVQDYFTVCRAKLDPDLRRLQRILQLQAFQIDSLKPQKGEEEKSGPPCQ